MKISYARVSTNEQNLDLQLDTLKAAGCEKIFTDEGISGMAVKRDGLSKSNYIMPRRCVKKGLDLPKSALYLKCIRKWLAEL